MTARTTSTTITEQRFGSESHKETLPLLQHTTYTGHHHALAAAAAKEFRPSSSKSVPPSSTRPGRLLPVTGLAKYLQPAAFVVYFITLCICINFMFPVCLMIAYTPLRYLVSFDAIRVGRRWGKSMFATVLIGCSQFFAPTELRITTEGMPLNELIERSPEAYGGWGDLKLPKRVVAVANHQSYPDFIYIWLATYFGNMQGSMLILLKDAVKHLPLFGWGMQFFDFVFLRRRWEVDQERIAERLRLVSQGWEREDPLTLLLFPEGTIVGDQTRTSMHRFAKKTGWEGELPKYNLLPRVTGLHFILEQLQDSNVDYLYDITVGFDGVLRGEDPENVYSLNLFLNGAGPQGIHMHVRRWHIATEVPVHAGQKVFGEWLTARWMEKDAMLERFYTIGSMATGGTMEERAAQTAIKPVRVRSPAVEFGAILAIPFAYMVIWRLVMAYWGV
ncbi:acyltransferase-domain-containing protein [Thamnocephalis sphaerospora]|uniref:Acyltransferase-domain-containing protein n=1 Tax=Thamnocephalis sphaerospora TaxID=78915 RepID=A0A4P9XRF1_9FUNG|nr:acyltransferase-domain-containing protein [Thamnocephalis sphaerospora]|eukprot:RKP08664.1 acyltransferase-domain-containing protein [Thamnocephalis sphaerospora]